jgi:TorA maturation chaperone TorD
VIEHADFFALAGKALLTPDFEFDPAEVEGGEELAAALGGDREALHKEHVRLFLSPDGALCPPWQSVYGDPPQLLGDAHHSALAWYRRAGMTPRADNEPADHAGLLLIFLARMLEAGAPEEEIALYRQQHLDWLDGLMKSIAEGTRHPFYRLLAERVRNELKQLREA